MIDFPNSPTVGQVTTTPGGISWRWDGTTWLMVGGGSSGASGLVGYNDGFSQAVTTGTTEAALMVGPQPTFDAPGGRRYKITFTFTGAPNTAADMFLFKIRRGNGITGAVVWTGPSDVVTVGNSPYNIVAYDTPPVGATQYTLTVVRQSGTGTFTMHGQVNYGNFVSVEDVTFQPGASGSGSGGGGSGFTYVQDTKPTAAKQGDTWFNTATTAGGGSSLVAVNETPGNTSSELVWVQFSPTTVPPVPVMGGWWARNAAPSIPNLVVYPIPWDTETTDTHGFLTPTSDTITIPVGCDGVYTICMAAYPGAAQGFCGVVLSTVGASPLHTSGPPNGVNGWCSANVTLKLAAGNTIKGVVWQNSGATAGVGGSAQIQVWRVA